MIFSNGNGSSPRIAQLSVNIGSTTTSSASTYSSSTTASTYSSSTTASTYSSTTASTYSTTVITTAFPTSTPNSIIGCQSKDGWPYTKAGQNATGTFCFDGTVNGYIILIKYNTCNNLFLGTRHCNKDGAWEMPYCQASNSFYEVLKAVCNKIFIYV